MTVMIDLTDTYTSEFKFFLREGNKFCLLFFFEYLLRDLSGGAVYPMVSPGIPFNIAGTPHL